MLEKLTAEMPTYIAITSQSLTLIIAMLAAIILLLIFALVSLRKNSGGESHAQVTTPQAPAAPIQAAPITAEDDTELIAVLTAAVAACSGMKTSEFRVVNFKRTGR